MASREFGPRADFCSRWPFRAEHSQNSVPVLLVASSDSKTTRLAIPHRQVPANLISLNSHANISCSSDICGFFFRDPLSYTPSPELANFLASGPLLIYIGFGSIVIDNPGNLTAILLAAVKMANVRAIISRGWSKLGGEDLPNVLYLGDCPHEWLFQHVSMVIHRGGAGTTACGLLNATPIRPRRLSRSLEGR